MRTSRHKNVGSGRLAFQKVVRPEGADGEQDVSTSNRLSDFNFTHIVVVKELVLAVIPSDPYARPIAGCYRALIIRAIVPCHALVYPQFSGLGWSHEGALPARVGMQGT